MNGGGDEERSKRKEALVVKVHAILKTSSISALYGTMLS